MQNFKKVFVAMSGGVDSSVAAALLKKDGYEVTGVYMKNWSGDDYGIQPDCPWEAEMADAKKICEVLDIPFMSFNFEKEYRAKVVDYFFSEYKKGRTPNPDVMCNREIKFDLFLKKSRKEGADAIATGHYAQVEKVGEEYKLVKSQDVKKDQTYFLYNLNQKQLSRILFPIGHLAKAEVRKLAAEFKLPNAQKKDSQGICFIGEIDVREFLRKSIATKPGKIVDIDTKKTVGKHDGVMYYTIGQREGLKIGGAETPYYVVEKDAKKKILYVSKGRDNKYLLRKTLKLENFHSISGSLDSSIEKKKLKGTVRYHGKEIPMSINNKLEVKFTSDQWAVAPGQSLVVYSGEECVGGGVIQA